jgi:heat shock protein HslJ
LSQTDWTLVFYNNLQGGLVTPLPDSTITVRFAADGRLSGSAGCNTYNAPYEMTDTGITVGPAASTRRLCAEPEGVMEQEAAFLGLLPEIRSYTLKGDRLEFQDDQGRTLLRFTTAL